MRRDVDAGLFPRLANRRVLEVAIGRIHATAGTGNVPAPRILLELSAFDHQQLGLTIRAKPKHERNRRVACNAFGFELAP